VPLQGTNGPCELSIGGPAICVAVDESEPEPTTNNAFRGLTSVAPDVGDNADNLVLSSTITTQNNGTIPQVVAQMGSCPPSMSVDNCLADLIFTVTSANLDQAIDVIANQVVAFEVVLSFQ
jgi:hypothetical protein